MSVIDSLVGSARAILIDFDGPVCDLFSNLSAASIAVELKKLLDASEVELSEEARETLNPLMLLRWTGARHPELLGFIENAYRKSEFAAADSANPTLASREVFEAATKSSRPVVIVSNNSEMAIGHYLQKHGLGRHVTGIVARQYAQLDRMKPNPFPVIRALNLLDEPGERCVLIGDEPTDMEAARRAGTPGIGFAKRADRVAELSVAGAFAVVDSMKQIANALQRPVS